MGNFFGRRLKKDNVQLREENQKLKNELNEAKKKQKQMENLIAQVRENDIKQKKATASRFPGRKMRPSRSFDEIRVMQRPVVSQIEEVDELLFCSEDSPSRFPQQLPRPRFYRDQEMRALDGYNNPLLPYTGENFGSVDAKSIGIEVPHSGNRSCAIPVPNSDPAHRRFLPEPSLTPSQQSYINMRKPIADSFDVIYRGNTDLIQKTVRESREKLKERDKHDQTLFHYTARREKNDLLRYLLLLDTDSTVNNVDTWGKTALHWASEMGHTETVRILVSFDADQTISDHNGCLPCDVICRVMGSHADREEIQRILQPGYSTSINS